MKIRLCRFIGKQFLNMLFIFNSIGCSAAAGDRAVPALLLEQWRARPARVYFTDPRPAIASDFRFAARDRLIDLIDNAQQEIRVWAYGLDEPRMIAALVSAAARGVRVSVIGSPDQDYAELEKAFERGRIRLDLAIRTRSGLQHLKLVVVDEKTAFSGTGNFTRSGFLFNHNAFLEFQIRDAYRRQWRGFLRHLERETETRDAFLEESGATAATGPQFTLAPGVHAIVSPAHGRLIQSRLTRAVLHAQRRIRFLIFSFTDPVLAAALLRQARRGIFLQGIADDPRNAGMVDPVSMAGRLNRKLGFSTAELYLEGNRRVFAEGGVFHGGHLHHKTLLIDDRRVLTGSYNWSLSARDRNLEVLFDIEDAEIAAEFQREFERIRRRAVLLGRPPQIVAPESAEYDPTADRICAAPAGELTNGEDPFTFFAGYGPYFRAFHFTTAAMQADAKSPGSRCAPLAAAGKASAGIQTGKSYQLAPAGESLESRRPCATATDCDPVTLRRASLNEGWLWLSEDASALSPTGITIWNHDGDSPASDSRLDRAPEPGFYRFETRSASDALLFLQGAGRVRIACVRYGPTLERPLREFLAAFAAERGVAPRCIAGE